MENVQQNRDIKLVATEETISYQNEIIILQSFLQKICSLWIGKNLKNF